MKNLYKKVSTVALVGMTVFGGSGLSQGFVAHANSCNSGVSCVESVNTYSTVVRYSTEFNYSYKQLESAPSRPDGTYKDRFDFKDNIKKLLDKFRDKKDFLDIKIGKSGYRLFYRKFRDDNRQDTYTSISEIGEQTGFRIIDVADATSNPSLVTMLARTRTNFANKPKVMDKLIKNPVLYFDSDWLAQAPKSISYYLKKSPEEARYLRIGVGNVIFIIEKI